MVDLFVIEVTRMTGANPSTQRTGSLFHEWSVFMQNHVALNFPARGKLNFFETLTWHYLE